MPLRRRSSPYPLRDVFGEIRPIAGDGVAAPSELELERLQRKYLWAKPPGKGERAGPCPWLVSDADADLEIMG